MCQDWGKVFPQVPEECSGRKTPVNNFLVDLNRKVASDIKYTIRMQPGVQTPEKHSTSVGVPVGIQPGCWSNSFAIWVWLPVFCFGLSGSADLRRQVAGYPSGP